jgi:hypothetical protein
VSLPVPATVVEVTPASHDAAALTAAFHGWQQLVLSA